MMQERAELVLATAFGEHGFHLLIEAPLFDHQEEDVDQDDARVTDNAGRGGREVGGQLAQIYFTQHLAQLWHLAETKECGDIGGQAFEVGLIAGRGLDHLYDVFANHVPNRDQEHKDGDKGGGKADPARKVPRRDAHATEEAHEGIEQVPNHH